MRPNAEKMLALTHTSMPRDLKKSSFSFGRPVVLPKNSAILHISEQTHLITSFLEKDVDVLFTPSVGTSVQLRLTELYAPPLGFP